MNAGVMRNMNPGHAHGIAAVISNLNTNRVALSGIEWRERRTAPRGSAYIEVGAGPVWADRTVDDRRIAFVGAAGSVHLAPNEFIGLQGRTMLVRGSDGDMRAALFGGGQVTSLGIPWTVAIVALAAYLIASTVAD